MENNSIATFEEKFATLDADKQMYILGMIQAFILVQTLENKKD